MFLRGQGGVLAGFLGLFFCNHVWELRGRACEEANDIPRYARILSNFLRFIIAGNQDTIVMSGRDKIIASCAVVTTVALVALIIVLIREVRDAKRVAIEKVESLEARRRPRSHRFSTRGTC